MGYILRGVLEDIVHMYMFLKKVSVRGNRLVQVVDQQLVQHVRKLSNNTSSTVDFNQLFDNIDTYYCRRINYSAV